MKSVFIVDDSVRNAEMLLLSVKWETLGLRVCGIFGNPSAALEAFQAEPADIVITDIKMPGMSGIEMARKLFANRSAVKVILMSGYGEIRDVQEGMRIGVFDYLEKPVNIDYLQQLLIKATKRIDEEAHIQKQLLERKSLLLDNYLERMLTVSQVSVTDLLQFSEYFDLAIYARFYLCVCINCLHTDALRERIGVDNYYKNIIGIENRIRECFSSCRMLRCLYRLDQIVLVVGDDAACAQDFSTACSEKIEALLDEISLDDTVAGIGLPITKFSELYRSFETAKSALEFRFFFSNEHIFNYQDMPKAHGHIRFFMEDKSEALIQAISKNAKQQVRDLIRSYCKACAQQHMDKASLYLAVYDMGGNVIRFLNELGIVSGLGVKTAPGLDEFQTQDELAEWLEGLCFAACDAFDHSMRSYQSQLTAAVDLYISEHYTDSELRLKDIADHVGITTTYLSALYKKANGKNVTDTIVDLRINAAKNKLAYTSASIKAISSETGFSNQYYFSTCFKKHTGQTPSEFRESASAETP